MERRKSNSAINKLSFGAFQETNKKFQLPKHELANQSIRLDVLSIEKSKRTLLIGFIVFPLNILTKTESHWRPMRIARDLQLGGSSNPSPLFRYS
ncbi:hypothetical protein ACTXT7_002192 [Hymenolepis weldensis]